MKATKRSLNLQGDDIENQPNHGPKRLPTESEGENSSPDDVVKIECSNTMDENSDMGVQRLDVQNSPMKSLCTRQVAPLQDVPINLTCPQGTPVNSPRKMPPSTDNTLYQHGGHPLEKSPAKQKLCFEDTRSYPEEPCSTVSVNKVTISKSIEHSNSMNTVPVDLVENAPVDLMENAPVNLSRHKHTDEPQMAPLNLATPLKQSAVLSLPHPMTPLSSITPMKKIPAMTQVTPSNLLTPGPPSVQYTPSVDPPLEPVNLSSPPKSRKSEQKCKTPQKKTPRKVLPLPAIAPKPAPTQSLPQLTPLQNVPASIALHTGGHQLIALQQAQCANLPQAQPYAILHSPPPSKYCPQRKNDNVLLTPPPSRNQHVVPPRSLFQTPPPNKQPSQNNGPLATVLQTPPTGKFLSSIHAKTTNLFHTPPPSSKNSSTPVNKRNALSISSILQTPPPTPTYDKTKPSGGSLLHTSPRVQPPGGHILQTPSTNKHPTLTLTLTPNTKPQSLINPHITSLLLTPPPTPVTGIPQTTNTHVGKEPETLKSGALLSYPKTYPKMSKPVLPQPYIPSPQTPTLTPKHPLPIQHTPLHTSQNQYTPNSKLIPTPQSHYTRTTPNQHTLPTLRRTPQGKLPHPPFTTPPREGSLLRCMPKETEDTILGALALVELSQSPH